MTRIVSHEATAPVEVKVGDGSAWICMCGLSRTKPLCDGSHKQCRGEEPGKVYRYVEGRRVEVEG